jgi:hypothetical protein
MHDFAFHMAVEHTMKEIEKLFEAAAGVEIAGLKLTDIFKMDKDAMKANKVEYSGKHDKGGG